VALHALAVALGHGERAAALVAGAVIAGAQRGYGRCVGLTLDEATGRFYYLGDEDHGPFPVSKRCAPRASSLCPVAATRTLHRLSPELYDRMVEAGLLADEPVELVDGLLIHMTPQGWEHASVIRYLTQAFGARLDLLCVQLPVAMPTGRPEPDVALAANEPGRLAHTVYLAVEVAVTNRPDAVAKLPDYARGLVPTVWLIDVPARTVSLYEHPSADGTYRSVRVLRSGDTLPVDVEGLSSVAVTELFAVLDQADPAH
jgi:Uma2 family endonuclease